jgi:hypothetical protein
MDMFPAAIGMQMAITQQKATMSMIKSSAEAQQAVVDMIAEVSSQIASSGRGQIVNIAA